jgi:hypothetical protein
LTADPTFAAVSGDKWQIGARVATRYEYRNNKNFGSSGFSGSDSFVVQNTSINFGYFATPDLGFYMNIQDSRTWGATTDGGGNQGGGLGFNGPGAINGNALGLREGYVHIKNLLAPKLSAKIGRQKLVFGNQRILGHFDWSNIGWSFDGVRLDYQSSEKMSHTLGWFRVAEDDCANAVSLCQSGAGGGSNATGGKDSDFILFYNTLKMVPKHTIDLYSIHILDGRTAGATTGGAGGVRTQPDQKRHMFGLRVNGRPIKMLDYTFEYVYQTGRQKNGIGGTNNINAQALASNIGVTLPVPMKPRIAFELDYATGSGADRGTTGGRSTFENFWPTNHLHYGYMDLMGWKNMLSFGPKFSMKPSKNGTFKVDFWWHRLADKDDNWYGAGQGANFGGTVAGNGEAEIGQELNITYIHKFFGGKSKIVAGYGHFFTGDYIKKSGNGKDGAANLNDDDDQDWGYVWWITKF